MEFFVSIRRYFVEIYTVNAQKSYLFTRKMKAIEERKARLFALAWTKGLRGKELLFAAGLKVTNVSRTISKYANHPQVLKLIKEIEEEKEALRDVDTSALMVHLARICYFDGQQLWELANNPDQEWSEAAKASISSIKVTKSYRNGIEKDEYLMDVATEVRSKDTLKAAKMLGDHLGAFKDLPTLLSGLKSYGIEVERVDGKFQVVNDDSDQSAA